MDIGKDHLWGERRLVLVAEAQARQLNVSMHCSYSWADIVTLVEYQTFLTNCFELFLATMQCLRFKFYKKRRTATEREKTKMKNSNNTSNSINTRTTNKCKKTTMALSWPVLSPCRRVAMRGASRAWKLGRLHVLLGLGGRLCGQRCSCLFTMKK